MMKIGSIKLTFKLTDTKNKGLSADIYKLLKCDNFPKTSQKRIKSIDYQYNKYVK